MESTEEVTKLIAEEADRDFAKAQALMQAGGSDKLTDEAILLYRQAAAKGHPQALYVVARNLLDQKMSEAETRNAVILLRNAAEKGHVEAMYDLGVLLSRGQGALKNRTEAARWFVRAAKEGHSGAAFETGECFALGRGVKRDKASAIAWYESAAAAGNARAMLALGNWHSRTKTLPELAKAQEWLKKAIGAGLTEAQPPLAACLKLTRDLEAREAGRKLKEARRAEREAKRAESCAKEPKPVLPAKQTEPLDPPSPPADAKAEDLWNKESLALATKRLQAAERGQAEEQFALGEQCRLGQGLRRNSRSAVSWYRQAAAQNHPQACLRLGLCYAEGFGVPKNAGLAREWLTKARDFGLPDAEEALAKVSSQKACEQAASASAASPFLHGSEFWHAPDGILDREQEPDTAEPAAKDGRADGRKRRGKPATSAPLHCWDVTQAQSLTAQNTPGESPTAQSPTAPSVTGEGPIAHDSVAQGTAGASYAKAPIKIRRRVRQQEPSRASDGQKDTRQADNNEPESPKEGIATHAK